MKIPFAKLHGAKNDFLITRAEQAPVVDFEELAIAICDRHTGVGADGWMLLDRTGGEGFDASIRLFNSDGSEPELSGNGTRWPSPTETTFTSGPGQASSTSG